MFEETHPAIRAPSLARQKAALWLALAIIAAASLLAFLSIQQLLAASARVQHSQSVLIELNRFLSDLKDVETGGRGYALSGGDVRHLQRQEQGIAAVNASGERLRKLADEPRLSQELDRLLPLAGERIARSRRLVAERDDKAATRRNLMAGLQLMDRIRGEVATILDDQLRAYAESHAQLSRRARLASIVLAASVALCLSIIAWLFALRGREVEGRRQLEEELRALNLELEDRVQERTADVKRAGDLLMAVVENLPDMVLLKEPCDDGFCYVLVNAAGEKMLGRERSDIIGKTERQLFPAAEAKEIVRANKAVLESGRPQVFLDRMLTTSLGERRVETRMVPVGNGSGGPKMILAMVRDVTDARSRDEQLRQLQRIDAVGRLTGGVAHDFNNLLAIVHGNSELLRARLEEGSDDADMADDIIGAARRGAELVKRLLAFARMQHLEPEAVDLNARLTNILNLLERSLGERVRVRVRPKRGLWPAIVDPTQVDDAIINLAINARDAMAGDGTLTIETENATLDEDYAANHVEVIPGDYVMLAVSDTGSGMTAEVISRAFEPFFTTKPEGQGTGLGLSQVFGWVKQSGGHIKIYSEVGHGTTIKLYLPRAEAQEKVAKGTAETAALRGDETILVVEDNPNVRKTVLRQLHDLGYRTIEADSGNAALKLVRDGARFDLLLTDVIMPGGLTGYQLADELRRDRPDLKVLFTSGYTELAASSDQPDRKDALLSKPYRKQDLGRAVRAALDTKPGVPA